MPWWIWPCAWLCAGFLACWIILIAWRNKWGDLDKVNWGVIAVLFLIGPYGLFCSLTAVCLLADANHE